MIRALLYLSRVPNLLGFDFDFDFDFQYCEPQNVFCFLCKIRSLIIIAESLLGLGFGDYLNLMKMCGDY